MSPRDIDPELFSADVREFLRLLHRYSVRYLLVGGHAAIIHGNPRVTGDTDVFYDRDGTNCDRLYLALREFWAGDVPGIKCGAELAQEGVITQFGRPPNRLDLINSIDGVSFEEAWTNGEMYVAPMTSGDLGIRVLSKADFLRNKKASGRPKDLDDIEAIEG